MNNRQFDKARERGPKGPCGFSLNHLLSYSKGVKKAMRVFKEAIYKGDQNLCQNVQRAMWIFDKPPEKRIKTHAKSQQQLPGKLVQQEK
jgi:hypothetical protein